MGKLENKIELISGGLLNVRDAAKFTGIGKSKLYQLMADGQLVYCKIGSARRIPKRALQEFLARSLVMRDEV